MRSLFINTQPTGCQLLKNATGQMIVMLALSITMLLAATGYAIDAANLALKKERLQRALDAGAIAGMNYYVEHVRNVGINLLTPKDIQENAKKAAKATANYNLRQMGFDMSESIVTPTWITEGLTSRLNIRGQTTIKTFFMNLVGITSATIDSTAKAQRDPAYISLVMDTSGSMTSDLPALKNAAKNFLTMFQEGIDHIAIVSFGTNVTVDSPMAALGASDHSLNDLEAIVDGFTAYGNTDLPEAIARGRIEIENANAPSNAVKAIVLFTDGAPNVMRGTFTDPWTESMYPGGIPTRTTGPGYDGLGPLPFFPPDQTIIYDYKLFVHYNSQHPHQYQKLFTDPIQQSGRNEYTTIEPCVDAGNPNLENAIDCLKTFSYRDSRGHLRSPTPALKAVWYQSYGNEPTYDALFLKEIYALSILEADYARLENITIYVIGLGTSASLPLCPDGITVKKGDGSNCTQLCPDGTTVKIGEGANCPKCSDGVTQKDATGSNCPQMCSDGKTVKVGEGANCPQICDDNIHWYSFPQTKADCPQTDCLYSGMQSNRPINDCPSHKCYNGTTDFAYNIPCPKCNDGTSSDKADADGSNCLCLDQVTHFTNSTGSNCPQTTCPDGVTQGTFYNDCPKCPDGSTLKTDPDGTNCPKCPDGITYKSNYYVCPKCGDGTYVQSDNLSCTEHQGEGGL